MSQFSSLYPKSITKQAVSQLPWGHIVVLMQQVKDDKIREWYAQNTITNGISRNILVMQIEQDLYHRQGRNSGKVSNFKDRMPAPQSDLAIQMLKNPYNFDFLTVTSKAKEREIEAALIQNISKFLLELGTGFSFLGSQYKLTIEGDDYFLDLLFYHLKLRCYVVVELKAIPFKPEHAGKLNFYLSAVDDILKTNQDNPTIGLLLCKTRNRVIAEYSLKNLSSPIRISEYELVRKLPKQLTEILPSIEELETELKEVEKNSCPKVTVQYKNRNSN